tara:strand:- start:5388 stop:6113 length:726 start_codon:yes stop_codon:yes gene_type:complete
MVKSPTKENIYQFLSELRQRFVKFLIFFIILFTIGYYFSEEIYCFLLEPLEINAKKTHRIIYTSPIEAFLSYLKLSITFALFLSLPVIIFQIYSFITPALYKKEKKIFLLISCLSPILFFIGIITCYYLLLPAALKFFLSFENVNAVTPIILEAKISEYLKLVINITFVFGLIFQIPLLFILLIKFKKIDKKYLKKFRKYYIVLSFVIGAICSPPDIFSQIIIAVIMIIFYEITLLFVKNK